MKPDMTSLPMWLRLCFWLGWAQVPVMMDLSSDRRAMTRTRS